MLAIVVWLRWLARCSPNPPDAQFADRAYAPPTRVHIWDASGLHRPFIYQQRLQNRLLREYRDDSALRVPFD